MKINKLENIFDEVDKSQETLIEHEDDNGSSLDTFLEEVVEHGRSYTSDGSVGQTLTEVKAVRPLLVVSAMCVEELRYIKSLEASLNVSDYSEGSLIDVCYLIEEGAKPICKLPLTFEAIMAIKSYRDMDMQVVYNGSKELTTEAILNLP